MSARDVEGGILAALYVALLRFRCRECIDSGAW